MTALYEKRWVLLMLAAETVATYVMLNVAGVPLIVCALGAMGVFLGISFALSSFRLLVVCSIMLLYLYVRNVFFPLQIGQATHTFGSFGTILAEYVMLVQLVQLFWRREGGTTVFFGLSGGMVMMFAGDHAARGWEYPAYQGMVVAYVICLAMMMADYRNRSRLSGVRRGSAIVVVNLILVIGSLSAGTSFGLYYYQDELDAAIANMAYPIDDFGGVRLDQEVSLGSVAKAQIEGRTKVALRIESENSPGYMRANVFDRYESPDWINSSPMREVRPVYWNDATGVQRFPLEALSELKRPDAQLSELVVWPDADGGRDIFTQLDTAFVELEHASMSADLHDTAHSDGRRTGAQYRLYVDNAKRGAPMPAEMLEDYLKVPDSIGPEIRDTAEEIFADAHSSDAKALKVVQYFVEHYAYEIGIQVPRGEEPLNYFVREQAAAHCEYFASASVMLLRLGGVPARYVTGFLAMERNSVGGYWIARSRDAHAWVEMWDGKQWVIVEATPTAGVPHQGMVTESDHASDAWKLRWQQWREGLMSGQAYRWVVGQIQSFLEWLRGFILSPLGIGIVGGGVLIVVLRSWVRKRRGSHVVIQERDELGCLLERMEHWLASRGLRREQAETLTQFAERIEEDSTLHGLDDREIAGWYREYVALRYDPHTKADERMRSLDSMLREMLEREAATR